MSENRHIGLLGTVVTVIILILLIVLTNVDTTEKSYFESLVSSITSPFQTTITKIKNKFSGNNDFFVSMDELKKENEELKLENKKLSEQLIEYNVVKSENDILKEKMNLTEKYVNYSTIAADVINKDVSNYSSTLILNVGKNDGIAKGMNVIADKGLVGYVISTTDTTSKVQVIIDPASTVSCNIS